MVFGKVMTMLAFASIFSGVIGTIILDILIIPASPEQGIKLLISDVAKTIFVSQNQISDAIKQFGEASAMEKEFLMWRIVAGSLVTLGIIWLGYKALSFLVPGVSTDLGARLIVLILIIGLIWGVSLVYSVSTDRGWVWPFSGWIDLIRHSEEIREFVAEKYSTKLNETIT